MFKDYLVTHDDVYLPQFFNLENTSQKDELKKLLQTIPSIAVVDQIEAQLYELIKLRNPHKKLLPEEYQELLGQYMDGRSLETVGVWVYYPWLNRVVHLLEEKEFVEVRTNRNHYKITPQEEQELFEKKIGIIGLSVGKAIATTIALERICGEIVLADFDEIELSNLNRIRTSVLNLGIKKTIVVAREIAEIDPYIKVTCLHQGVIEKNIEDFFLKGKKMNLCIEVCDGLYAKVFVRQKAKQFGVPVVMNSSDRGTTDIERYDLHPELPILHGLIDHLDVSLLKNAKTNEEKVPYLLPMLGIDTCSDRLKASMIEIEETITTWPQLASGVVLGGSLCTDVCRRILLGKFQASGRYIVDLEKIIGDDVKSVVKTKEKSINYSKTKASKLEDYLEEIDRFNSLFPENKSSRLLNNEDIDVLVEAASLAPSGGNIQPWKWIFKDGLLFLFNDVYRKNSILNYKNYANFLTFGLATENLIHQAEALDIGVDYQKFPLGKEANLINVFSFSNKQKSLKSNLAKYIPLRSTNRRIFKAEKLSELQLEILENSVKETEGAQLKVFDRVQEQEQIKSVLCELDRLFYTNKAGHNHFMNELRWDEGENQFTRDGLDLETIDLTPTEKVGLIVSKKWDVVQYSERWKLGGAFGKAMGKVITNASALAMLTMPKDDEFNYFEGGRAMERLWLTATKLNIGIQPISINTFIFPRVEDGCFEGLSPISSSLEKLSQSFFNIDGLNDAGRQNIFFFRLVSDANPAKRSLRRGVEDVLIYV